jgi:predicted  nucleic acid-binding Zn-ribbon protein
MPPLLLAVSPSFPTIGTIMHELIPVAGVLFAIYTRWEVKNNGETQRLKDAIKHLETICNQHALLHQSHQTERERLVDVNNLWKKTIEDRLNNVDNLVNEVQLLKARMESQNEQIKSIKEKVTELNVTVKESNKEILDMVKKLYAKGV